MRQTKVQVGSILGAAILLFGLGFASAQQPGVPAAQAEPMKSSASGARPKTMEDLVLGGKAAMSGAGEQAAPAKVAQLGDEGLKMHGHWTIDVRNPDGTLAEHRDFENSIQYGGQAYLIGLMAGYVVPADYEIYLQASGTNASPCLSSGGNQGCIIVRTTSTSPGNVSCSYYLCSATLVYSTTQAYMTNANSFVLTGSATANQTGTIDYVSTYAGSCPAAPIQTTLGTVAPGSCPAASGNNPSLNALTAKPLGTAISVTSGQLVQVVVTITFS